jgi:hypothetical protein
MYIRLRKTVHASLTFVATPCFHGHCKMPCILQGATLTLRCSWEHRVATNMSEKHVQSFSNVCTWSIWSHFLVWSSCCIVGKLFEFLTSKQCQFGEYESILTPSTYYYKLQDRAVQLSTINKGPIGHVHKTMCRYARWPCYCVRIREPTYLYFILYFKCHSSAKRAPALSGIIGQ